MEVRTRFAPSPTGRLHLGNLRVAAFNWLLARHYHGSFIVRLEDTDAERNVEAAEDAILDDLRWLGFDWSEGPDRGGPYEPYRQSERLSSYATAAAALVQSGCAYRCYCSEADLEAKRVRVRDGAVLRYSGRCRELTRAERGRLEASDKSWTVRFAVPTGAETVEIRDEVRGTIAFPNNDLDDFIILRSDGRPTYNFAVVVDDVAMRITHVVRGAGHLSNTPRQALLFDAMGCARPSFAHLPTVLAPEGGRLSKRSGSASVELLRSMGYNTDGVLNYVSLLGWSSPDQREVLTRDELVGSVSLARVGASDTAYDPEKLRWLSGQHIAKMGLQELVAAVEPFVDRSRFPLDEAGLRIAVETLRSRMSAYGEINEHLTHFFPPIDADLERARREIREDPGARQVLSALAAALEEVDAWVPAAINSTIRAVGKELGVRGAALFHPLRTAVTGRTSGPDLGGVLASLGREEVLARVSRTLGPQGFDGPDDAF